MKLHIILNSHLDPVWLWDKSAGMDEVIATARTACDMLDDYPEIFVTRGEAWFYDILEACAPELYARVKSHIASGRWQVVGNWYIQALDKDNRERVDYRVFNRETGSFYENTPKMMLSLAGKDILQVNGKFVPSDEIVIQRYIGAEDRNGKKIYEGDYLLTNEGNWRGFVVFDGGLFGIVDPHGGYSAEPEWEMCEIISNICEMNGNTQKYLHNMKGERTQQDSSPVVRFMNLPF